MYTCSTCVRMYKREMKNPPPGTSFILQVTRLSVSFLTGTLFSVVSLHFDQRVTMNEKGVFCLSKNGSQL